MPLPGLRSTNDMGTDGRPKNWRKGIQLLEPRNGAKLFALTADMRSESTDDPEFNWWEETLDVTTLQLNGAIGTTSGTTFTVDENANRYKAGDMFYNAVTDECIRVLSVTSDTVFEAERGSANTTPATMLDNAKLIYLGSAYREGAGRAVGTSYNPTKKYNYTQIFRDPIEWTRTAKKTTLRYTDSIQKEDRRRAMNKHAMGIERAMILGKRYETTEANQPIRWTGGLVSFIPAANKVSVQGGGGALDMDELESLMPDIFAYGSSEKLAFCSLATLTVLAGVVRKNSQYQWLPQDREYGMILNKLRTPAGVLALTEHPLFGQADAFLQQSMLVVDTDKLKYRYVDDTSLLKDREDKGVDGTAEEYLTECGLEVHNGECFYLLNGIVSAAADS